MAVPGKTKKIRQADRISYSRGSKVSDGNYGSQDVHVSYSTDLAVGESPEDCLKRASAFVEKALARKLRKITP